LFPIRNTYIEELELASISQIHTTETTLSITYSDITSLAIEFECNDKGRIVGILNVIEVNPMWSRLQNSQTPNYVILFGNKLRVLFNEDDDGVDNGGCIHISQLIRSLILSTH
jgi:hypothetical protein